MSETEGGAPAERPEPSRPKPPPAREAGAPPNGSVPSFGRRARQAGRGSKRPTPARDPSAAAEIPAHAEPVVEERVFEAEGSRWLVRVLGRASAGRTGPGAHLLLLGFWPDGSTAEVPERESLVAGGGVEALEVGQLRRALARAAAPPDPHRPKPFFEVGRRRSG